MALPLTNRKGFTLIELLIAVAIVGILTSVAYPSYVEYVTRSNRTEGQRELLRVANLMEQSFLDYRTYSTDLTKLGLASPYITEPGKHYSISATSADKNGFTIVATAQGIQASKDSGCLKMSVNEAGKKTATSSDCWE